MDELTLDDCCMFLPKSQCPGEHRQRSFIQYWKNDFTADVQNVFSMTMSHETIVKDYDWFDSRQVESDTELFIIQNVDEYAPWHLR